jgi:hypothetical protein
VSESFDPYYKWLAIPPDEQPPDHYRLFGIPPFTSDPDVIENAANRQEAHVRKYKGGQYGEMAEGLLGVISSARICLLNPKLKAAYDAQLKATQADAAAAAEPAPAAARPAAARPAAARIAEPASIAFTPSQSSAVKRRLQRKPTWQQPALIGGVVVALLAIAVAIYFFGSNGGRAVTANSNPPAAPQLPPKQANSGGLNTVNDPPADADDVPNTTRGGSTDGSTGTDGTDEIKQPVPPQNPMDDPKIEPIDEPVEDPAEAVAPVDLLSIIDAQRDAVVGNWTLDSGALVSPKGYNARLQIPYAPPENYDLTVTAKRFDGNDTLVIGLVVAGRQTAVVLDGWRGTTSGLDLLDGLRADGNESTIRRRVFSNGRPTTINCSVRNNHIVVHSGDEVVIDWQGDPQRLSTYKAWHVPNANCLIVGCFLTRYEITELTITPISNNGTVIRDNWREKIPYAEHVLAPVDHFMQITSNNTAPSYPARTFEAERDFQHRGGAAEADGWSATPGRHNATVILYGPFVKDLPGGGPHTATFRIMSDAAPRRAVAQIDVFDLTTNDLLAQREILWREFDQPMTYQDFALQFFCEPAHNLEFRVHWKQNAYVRVDRVTVAPSNAAKTGPWDVSFYRVPMESRGAVPSDETWTQAIAGEPLGRRPMDHLALFWHNRMGTVSWFATVATTQIDLPAGKYEFQTLSDDGVRVFLDDHLIINNWSVHPPRRDAETIDLPGGKQTIRVEHFNGTSLAQLQFWIRPLK